MKNIELNEFINGDMYCPRCGSIIKKESELFDIENLCEHVQFIVTDEGIEYSRDKDLYTELDNSDLNVNEFLSSKNYESTIMISSFTPAPSFFGEYIGIKL